VKALAVIAACLATGFALAACGESDSSKTTPSSVAMSEEGAGAAATKATSRTTHSQQPRGREKMSKAEIAKLPPLTIAKQSGPPPRHLQIVDLRKGTGATVTKHDAVTIRYFDAPYPEVLKESKTGVYGPSSFALVQSVTKGLIMGIPGMKVGGRRELIMTPRLVYPRWQPNWGYTPFVDVYVIDLLAIRPSEASLTR
jgi:peptidylprolyl isomerase